MKKMRWWDTLIGRDKSKDRAKERLQLVLLHDRSDMSPELLNQIKDEIVVVLSKYVEIDMAGMDVELTRATEGDGDLSAFVANIPIISVKGAKNKRLR